METPQKRINIEVPEVYKKVSDDVWKELEKYIYTGFLTTTSVICGQPFTFKTINHHELQLISYLRPVQPVMNDMFRSQFIAYSVFTINGSNSLYKRSDHIDQLIRIISKLPISAQDKIIENLSVLNERSVLLHPLVEVYAYENRSRFKWMHTKGMHIHSSINTGIPGTEEIGMNSCQQLWTALNQIIDRREEVERDWSHAKFIGSCFAGKGMRSIDERDRARLDKERSDREDLKMKVLYNYLNRNNSESDENLNIMTLSNGKRVRVVSKFKAEKADELAKELSAALSGEKDHHDMIIEAKIKEMQSRVSSLNEQRMKMYSMPSDQILKPGTTVLGSKEEVDSYIKRLEAIKEERLTKARNNARFEINRDEEASDE